jgi:endonuclease/exonuclease/phosphatase family metal-dependent hydrolase
MAAVMAPAMVHGLNGNRGLRAGRCDRQCQRTGSLRLGGSGKCRAGNGRAEKRGACEFYDVLFHGFLLGDEVTLRAKRGHWRCEMQPWRDQPEPKMNGEEQWSVPRLSWTLRVVFSSTAGHCSAMSVRIATFNVENLMNRFDFSGFHNELYQDRVLKLFDIKDEAQYRELERGRAIAHTDDTRQLTALAIAAARADIFCLQEIDNTDALKAFEYGYLFKMVGSGFRQKYVSSGNDSRGIDVAVMVREETAHGEPIEFVRMTSHAHVTYDEFRLHTPELAETGNDANERIFRRDCMEIDFRIGGKPLTLYVVHFKSMGSPRNGLTGREATMPVRDAEAKAVRRIIENRFGGDHAANKNWLICGDLNDYRERVVIEGDERTGYRFEVRHEDASSLNVLTEGGFSENAVERLPPQERWTLYHTRGPQERHLCQLDYLLLSQRLAKHNGTAKPDIIRNGQPWRTIFPPGQEVDRFPRTGWDRPKASDHCPVAVTVDLP